MRGLDTNVLVRYLAADDPRQTRAAEKLIEDYRQKKEPLFISILVLCELVWVLDRSYGQSKASIVATLERIVEADLFVIERDVLVRQGIEAYRSGKGNLADYLIGAIAHHAGCSDTVTLDHALAGHARFTVLR